MFDYYLLTWNNFDRNGTPYFIVVLILIWKKYSQSRSSAPWIKYSFIYLLKHFFTVMYIILFAWMYMTDCFN
jgi:hypothetical protein